MTFSEYRKEVDSTLNLLKLSEVDALSDSILESYVNGTWVFIIGNGGSAAAASHLCEDLGKGTLNDFKLQKRLKVLSLTDNTPYMLAWANDEGYESIFVEQLKNFAEPGALLISISGSGNSENILKAVEYANSCGMRTFAVTGFDGGKLVDSSRECLIVPSNNMGIVEAVHSVIFHYLLDDLHQRFAR